MKVLIVENDRAVLAVAETALQERGFDIMTCREGIRAIEIHKKWHPDLLIIAEKLPKYTGLEIIDFFQKRALFYFYFVECGLLFFKQTPHFSFVGGNIVSACK